MATMQRPQPLQNGQFGANIIIAKNMRKTALQAHYSCSVQKTNEKKQLMFEEWEDFENWRNGTMQRLYIAFEKWSVFVKK